MRFILSLCLFVSLIISACTLTTAPADAIESIPTTTQDLSTSTSIPVTATSNNTIGTASPAETATIICNKQSTWSTYTVAAGDTMFGIAQRGKTTVETLVSANCLVDAGLISVGQVLYVPSPIEARPPATVVATGEGDPRYTVELWWIVQGDAGNAGFPIGCGDSIVLQSSGIPANLSMDETVKRAFVYLVGDDDGSSSRSSNGWWNPLSATSITIDTFSIDGDHVTANFSGQLNLSGVCFDAQLEPQIALNIMSVTHTKSATIYVNGENLRDIFDMAGNNTKTTYTWEEFQYPETGN